MSDHDVLVCMRVRNMKSPPVPSRKARCDICGFRVWVSLRSPPIPRIRCMHCIMDEAEDGGGVDIGLARETLVEVSELLARRKH